MRTTKAIIITRKVHRHARIQKVLPEGVQLCKFYLFIFFFLTRGSK